MYLPKSTATPFTIAGGSEGLLYESHPKGEQTIAIVEMDGVYPARGFSINERCTETMITTEGSLEIEVDGNGEWLTLGVDDVYMVLPGHKYRMRGKGKSVVAISPVWDSKQNKIIDENGVEIPKESV